MSTGRRSSGSSSPRALTVSRWAATVLAFLVPVVVAWPALPGVDEVPDGFPSAGQPVLAVAATSTTVSSTVRSKTMPKNAYMRARPGHFCGTGPSAPRTKTAIGARYSRCTCRPGSTGTVASARPISGGSR
ncbi:hypothetical protein E1200_00910 [Actinomadura sp. GC306]|nr:hypothetical protein E1200_00910 [Actinomadura sp. GC306]